MAKQKNGQQKSAKSGRSMEAIVRGQVRKFHNVLQSSGIEAARNWLAKGAKRTLGRGKNRIEVTLPVAKLREALS